MRRPKFSIRLLLLLVTLVAIVLTIALAKVRQYERVGRDVETLDRMGFVVDLAAGDDNFLARFAAEYKGPPAYIRLYAGPLSSEETDEVIDIVGRNPSLQKLMVNVPIGEQDAAKLLALPLDSLGLSETAIGDTLDARASPTLEWLSFHRTRLNDDSLASLGPLPSLQYFDLTRTRVSDKSIEYLAGLPSLNTLILRRCKVTAEGADRLRNLRPDVEVHWEPLRRP